MMRRLLALAVFPVFASLAGCGDDGAGTVDAAVVMDAGPSGTPDVPRPSTIDTGLPSADRPVVMEMGGGVDVARDTAPTDGPPPPPDAAPAPVLMTPAPAGTTYVYVGSDRGIDILYMDATGALTNKSYFAYDPSIGFMNASFMVISDRYVYVVSDAAQAGMTAARMFAFSIDAMTGALTLLNSASTGGPQAVHVWVDKKRSKAFFVNFQDDAAMPMRADINTVGVFGLMPDGRIGAMLGSLLKAGRNPHAIYFPEPVGKMAYVPTLFDGQIVQYPVSDTGLGAADLTFSLVQPATDAGVPPAPDAAPPSDATGDARPPAQCTRNARNQGGRNPGPRHMDFSSDGKHGYLLTEYGAEVNLFEVGASDGKLQGTGRAPAQVISVVPPAIRPMVDFSRFGQRGAEVYLHPTGKWLYASVRFDVCDYSAAGVPTFQADREDGYVTRFTVAPGDGRLSDPQYVKVNREPRYFTITADGNFLIVVGQRSAMDNILAFKLDTSMAGAGKIIEPAVSKASTGPTWAGAPVSQARSIVTFKRP